MNRKCIEKKSSNKGDMFALVSGPEGFEVWKLCKNYDGKARGGMAKTWRYVQKGMEEKAARSLFARRVAA